MGLTMHALRQMVYGYTLLVPMNQSGHQWSTTHRVLKSHRSKINVIYMYNLKNNMHFRESLMSTNIMLLAHFFDHSLVHYYQ